MQYVVQCCSYVIVILKAQCIIVCFPGWFCCLFAHTEPQKRVWTLYWCCCISGKSLSSPVYYTYSKTRFIM